MLRKMDVRLTRIIDNPWRIFLMINEKGWLNWLADEPFLKLIYRGRLVKKLNIEDPKTFNEKLQWLKLNDKNPLYTRLVDKYEVRLYIAQTLGEEYLIPLFGVYNSFEEIEFSKLPSQFVLKCTHDSGGIVLCKDKNSLDIRTTRDKINRHFRNNYFYHSREWPYKNIKPRIICEQFMVDGSGTELIDYKFMCFNGDVKCLFVCLNRNSKTGLNVDFYDMDWNPMPFERYYPRSGTIIPKPIAFDKMVEFAHKLSTNIPFVRVDFYEVNGQIYFGELTFFPGSGNEEFTPESYDYLLGSWLELPSKICW